MPTTDKPEEEPHHNYVQNVLIFGESGVGKSSIVNLILGSHLAKTSPDANACTTRTEEYEVNINGRTFRILDTVGLDGGSYGRFRAATAERRLKKSIRSLLEKDELSLLIYCTRASRATRALVRHYRSVSALCENSVPMVIVVTGLENSVGDMENWWKKNAAGLFHHGMEFKDHACITSIDDDPGDSAQVRAHRTLSQTLVRDLISRNCVPRRSNRNDSSAKRFNLRGWPWTIMAYLVSFILPGSRN